MVHVLALHLYIESARLLQLNTNCIRFQLHSSSCLSQNPAVALTWAARGVYYFKVEDDSFLKNSLGSGDTFQSDTFSVGGYSWAVRITLRLHKVSIYLVMMSELKRHVSASFACVLMDKHGEPSAATEKRLCNTFVYTGQQRGIDNFVEQEGLNKFIQGDSFDVRCTISVHKKPI